MAGSLASLGGSFRKLARVIEKGFAKWGRELAEQ